MILEVDHWYLGYSQILKDCRENEEGGSVLILCNADVDAIAAARILAYMFRADEIAYQILPCMSYSQLDKILKTDVTESIRSVIMINLGASKNLTRYFEGDEAVDPSLKLFVMDCRRPVHLANVHAGDNVVVFWDSVQNDDVPSDGDNLSGNAESSSEEEDSSDEEPDSSDDEENQFGEDDEGEFEMEEDRPEAPERPELPENPLTDVDQNQETDYDGDDDEESDTSKPKRRKMDPADGSDDDGDDESLSGETDKENAQSQTQATMTPRELHEDRLKRILQYYGSGSFYGSPSAYVAHRIATQLRFGDVGDLLWLACVGVTDAYLHARLDVAGYTSIALDLRSHCNRLFPNDMYTQVGNAVFAEHLLGSSDEHMTKIGFSENGRLLAESDFRFFLLRHTSLFDAMVHSDFISTRLQLHTNKGMQKLQELLAKMGYPLEQCKQPFAFMRPGLRRRLRDQIHEHAEDYGLDNFEFTSFFRITGYQSLLSASDTSYATTALLECDTALSGSSLSDTEEEKMKHNFNLAYDALNSNSTPTVGLNGLSGEGSNVGSLVNGGSMSSSTGIGAGIRLAMKLQRNIMATAASLIERNAITRLSHFRYAYLTCTSQAEVQGGNDLSIRNRSNDEVKDHIFAKPLALSRLAHYLMDLHRENGKWTGTKARPLILLAEKPITDSYLVVGYEYPDSAGVFLKNRFGNKFTLAAESMEGEFRFDSFDSNVVEVSSRDVQRFLEQLHYLMDSM